MSLREDLKAYLDGELNPQRSEEIRLELDRNAELRREFEQLRVISEAVRLSAPEIVPVGLEQTLSALGRSRTRLGWVRSPWIWSGAAVTATLAAFVLFPMFGGRASDDAAMADKSVVAMEKAPAATKGMGDNAEAMLRAGESSRAPIVQLKAQRAIETEGSELSANATVGGASSTGTVALSARAAAKPAAPKSFVVRERNTESSQKDKLHGSPQTIWADANRLNNGFVATKPPPASVINPAPVTVALDFTSREAGTRQVMALVGKYAVPIDKGNTTYNSGAAKVQSVLMVELPEEVADKVIADLKQLPASPPAVFGYMAPTGQGRGGGAFGGEGSRAFGGGGGMGGALGKVSAPGAAGARSNDKMRDVNAVAEASARAAPSRGARSETSNVDGVTKADTRGGGGGRRAPIGSYDAKQPTGLVSSNVAAAKKSKTEGATPAPRAGENKITDRYKAVAPASDSTVNLSNTNTSYRKGKTRRVLIVISEKPKPVP